MTFDEFLAGFKARHPDAFGGERAVAINHPPLRPVAPVRPAPAPKDWDAQEPVPVPAEEDDDCGVEVEAVAEDEDVMTTEIDEPEHWWQK